ncbi:MAG: serine/threonine-protein kinase [Gemmatimonadaceae bacterium]
MPEPIASSSDSHLRAHVEKVLSASYELDREIGRGGMGIVYLARDRRLKRQVAVKLLPPELAFRGEIRTRFLREAETAAQLSHPNIVPIYAVDEREGLVFFVMAYVEGDNLAVQLHKRGALPFDEVRRVLLETARALAFAHERGVVHRDIKPDNILINSEDGRVMVTDFGIARAISDSDARLTATGIAIGTPAYMSPEQSMGEREVDGRSDLYALGIVGYQMITGELPFNATSTPALLVKHLSEMPTPVSHRVPSVPPDLGRAVMMMLEKEPDDRFPSAAALVAALETRNVPEPRGAAPAALGSQASRAMFGGTDAGMTAGGALAAPSGQELARWNAPEVRAFRKRLAPWMIAGGVAIPLSLFGIVDMVGLWGMYSIYIAWKYAKLWTEGYDWRDVLKEPRDRMFFDVVAEWVDNVRALWDPRKRAEVRERERGRRTSGLFDRDDAHSALPAGSQRPHDLPVSGPTARVLQEAQRNRDEILRLITSLPKREQQMIGDVPASAISLYERIQSLAISVAELERNVTADSANELDAEIAKLESEANPLDTVASEERVRRLAYLKRQRRVVADLSSRRSRAREKLESCVLALQNMRLEVVRLRSGPQNFQTITSVAEKAMALGREVDAAMYARDEMAKLNLGGRG